MLPKDTPIEHRLWSRVAKADGCWLWTGCTTRSGYGVLTVAQRQVYAHRLAWEVTNGPIRDGLHVCHRCDTPACCNPAHMFLGTHTENIMDATRKGRMRPGESNANAKLTDTAVREMRRRYGAGDVAQSALAREYGVSIGIVCDVINRKRWRHVPD